MRTVTIVGLGALGSHLVLLARNWQYVRLKLVDFDQIEHKNIHSQFHSKVGLRQNKATALSRAMLGLFGLEVDICPYRIRPDNIEPILGGSDLVIDCTDNLEARTLMQTFCRVNGIPCLHGALSADGMFARVIWTELFTPDPEGQPGQSTCEDEDHVAFYAMAGAHLAQTALTYLETGHKTSLQLTPASVLILD